MIDLEHNRSLLGESLQAKLNRLDDLKPADRRAERAVKRMNRGIRFRGTHRSSHLLVENGRVEIGSREPGYFKLLNLDGEHLGEIYAAWIITGKT